ncbi:MAG: hypothetical protein K8U57_06825 [Planctomycetes bacterium]|nr:hypothetical protein [Planctomycetota bacterium]
MGDRSLNCSDRNEPLGLDSKKRVYDRTGAELSLLTGQDGKVIKELLR